MSEPDVDLDMEQLGLEQEVELELGAELNWEKLWRGMPRYGHEDMRPFQSIYVHFRSPADREAFAKLVEQRISPSTKFIWHPQAEIGNAFDKVWTSDKRWTPRYPVYIISKGRADTRKTARAFDWYGIDYRICVEPQEADAYRAVIDPAKVLVLPFSNLGLGGIPARNFVWEHAVASGAKRHWIFDDNIDGLCRFVDNMKVEVDNAAPICAIEDWVDRYENVAMAGFNYDYFASRKWGFNVHPISVNCRVYSAILLSNEVPHRWRGRYNEDTDLSIRLLADGYCTALFNAFLAYKTPTLKMKGGNTDQLYAGVEATMAAWEGHCLGCPNGCTPDVSPDSCPEGRAILTADGRWLMGDSLKQQHPDITTVERKWRRWQHQVDYRRYRKNELKLKSGVLIDAKANEYGLVLDAMPADELARRKAARSRGNGVTRSAERRSRPRSEAEPESGPSIADLFGSAPQPASEPDPDGDGLAQAPPAELQGSPTTEPERPSIETFFGAADAPSLASMLGEAPPPAVDRAGWTADEPPDLTGIDDVVLNFATNGLDWRRGARPVGVTVSTLDGELVRFLPFAFAGGNLDEATIKRWAAEQLKGKRLHGSNVRFDVHESREWGVDLVEAGCRFRDVQHSAALLDDNRKKFALDLLIADYLPGVQTVGRVDETMHHQYHAADVAERERFTARATAMLASKFPGMLNAEDLMPVQLLEDRVIPAVVEMERNGAPLDMEWLERMQVECLRRREELLMAIAREVGFAFDHTGKSWDKLFDKLGLDPVEGHSADVIGQVDNIWVQLGHMAAKYASLNSKTFAAYKQNAIDGVLHFDINQLKGDEGGTVTGRFSAGYIQQVPNAGNHELDFGAHAKEMGYEDDLFPRRLFTAGPDALSYLAADAAQIQYRIFAHFAANAQILGMYRDDPRASFHKMMMAKIVKHKPDMIYGHVKNMNFMKIFGGGLAKLGFMMGHITAREAQELSRPGARAWDDPRLEETRKIQAIYDREMPEVGELLARASHLAKVECDDKCNPRGKHAQVIRDLHRKYPHRGYVKTIMGRRSRFPDGYRLHKAFCMVDQGSEGDIVKTKIADLFEARKELGFKLRMTVHDEITGDALSEETATKVDAMLNHQSFPELKVPILWETKTGKNWAECK